MAKKDIISDMKILVVLNEIKCSGVSKIVCWLSNSLSEKGNEVYLYTFMGNEDFYSVNAGVNRIKDSISVNNRFIRTHRLIKRLRSIYREKNIDVSVAFSPITSLAVILSCWGKRTKSVVAERNDPYLDKSSVADFCRNMYRFADGAVFQSKGAANYFPISLRNRSAIISNPVYLCENIRDYSLRDNVIVHISRLDIHQKRQDLLLEAFKSITDSFPQYRLKIYGDGDDRIKLEEQSKELGISDVVEFCGKTNNTYDALMNSKLFLFTSDFEGMPNVLLEAIASGTPVVTTDYSPGGAEDLIAENSCGYVAKRGDPDNIVNCVNTLLSNEDELIICSNNAINASKNYSPNKISDLWASYLSDVSNN